MDKKQGEEKMKCIYCGHDDSKVVDSRATVETNSIRTYAHKGKLSNPIVALKIATSDRKVILRILDFMLFIFSEFNLQMQSNSNLLILN